VFCSVWRNHNQHANSTNGIRQVFKSRAWVPLLACQPCCVPISWIPCLRTLLSLTAISPAPHDNCYDDNPAYVAAASLLPASKPHANPELASLESPSKIDVTLFLRLAQKPFPAISMQSSAAEALKKSAAILFSSTPLRCGRVCTHYTRPNSIFEANFLATSIDPAFFAKLSPPANNPKSLHFAFFILPCTFPPHFDRTRGRSTAVRRTKRLTLGPPAVSRRPGGWRFVSGRWGRRRR
jgi:hypothetical protein